jgi:O-antigen/teichoic acid export membrane protein
MARHGAVYMAAALASKAVGFLMIPLYTHYLSRADYGRLELLDLTATLIAMLAGMGIGTAAMRYYYDSDDPERGRRAISTAFLGGMAFVGAGALILVLAAKPIASILLDEAALYPLVFIQAAGLFLDTSCGVAQSYMRIQARSGLLAIVSTLRLVVGLTFNILFVAVYHFGIAGVLLGGLAGAIVGFSIQAVWLIRQVRVHFDKELFAKLWRYGAPLVPSAFATFAVAYADRFLLRTFGTLDDVGVYSLAYKFGFLVQFLLIGPLYMVWEPRIFDVAKRPDARETFARILTYWFVVLTWGALCLSVGAYEVIPHISPPPYWIGRTYIWLIALGYVFNGMQVYCRLGLLVTDRTRVIGKTVGMLSLVWIAAYAVLIWRLTALGGAIGTLMSYAGTWAAILFMAQRIYPIPIEWKRLAVAIGLGGAVYAATVYCMPERTILAMVLKAVVVLAYPGVLLAAGFLRPEERRLGWEWAGGGGRVVFHPFGQKSAGSVG